MLLFPNRMRSVFRAPTCAPPALAFFSVQPLSASERLHRCSRASGARGRCWCGPGAGPEPGLGARGLDSRSGRRLGRWGRTGRWCGRGTRWCGRHVGRGRRRRGAERRSRAAEREASRAAAPLGHVARARGLVHRRDGSRHDAHLRRRAARRPTRLHHRALPQASPSDPAGQCPQIIRSKNCIRKISKKS